MMKTDKLFLETLALLTRNSNQQNAADALLVAAKNLNLLSSQLEIENVLRVQGYVVANP